MNREDDLDKELREVMRSEAEESDGRCVPQSEARAASDPTTRIGGLDQGRCPGGLGHRMDRASCGRTRVRSSA